MKKIKFKIKMAEVIKNKTMPHFGIGRYVAEYVYKHKIRLNDSFFLILKLLWMEAEKLPDNDDVVSTKIKIYQAEKENILSCLKLERRFLRKTILRIRLKMVEKEKISFVELLAFYIKKDRTAAQKTKNMIRDIVEKQLDKLIKEKRAFSINEIWALAKIKEREERNSSDSFKYLQKMVDMAKRKGYTDEELLDAWGKLMHKKVKISQNLDGILELLLSGKNPPDKKVAEKYYRGLLEE